MFCLEVGSVSRSIWVLQPPDTQKHLPTPGNHPFNAETALSALGQGFVTPAAKGYVRNHGSVPRIDRTAHRLVVKGLGLPPAYAEKGRVFTMDELATLFPAKEVAVTFCCSGNRRREVNAVKPSIGVPFGAGAVRTSVFKGALLVDVLALCGLDRCVRVGGWVLVYVCVWGCLGSISLG